MWRERIFRNNIPSSQESDRQQSGFAVAARDLYSSITLGVSISLLQKYECFMLTIVLSANSMASDLCLIIEERRRHSRGSVAKNKERWMRHNGVRVGAAGIKHGAKETFKAPLVPLRKDIWFPTCASWNVWQHGLQLGSILETRG
jgi:hypothetical protein